MDESSYSAPLDSATVTTIGWGDPKRRPRRRCGQDVSVQEMNAALLEQQGAVFQVAGIVKMVSRGLMNDNADPDAWTALDGAYELLRDIADRLESCNSIMERGAD